MRRLARTARWRLRLRADRIRRRLWPGLLLPVWLGCASAHHPVPDVLPPTVVEVQLHRVVLAGRTYECAFQVLSDSTTTMPLPPDPVRTACEAAYFAWVRARHPGS